MTPSIVPARPAAAHPLARRTPTRTICYMRVPRSVWFLAAALCCAACTTGASTVPASETSVEVAESSPASSSTLGEVAPLDLVFWEGLLVLDASSGDLLRFNGTNWDRLQDGPGYDDGEAMAFVESAVSTSEGLLAGWCCEPVVGFVARTGEAYPSPLFYGTRPVWLPAKGAIVTFQDLFNEDGSLTTSLLVSMFDAEGYQSSEHPLPSLRQHGRRLLAVSPDTFAFTWSPDPPSPDMSPGGTWFLGFATLTAAGLDLRLETDVALPGILDLAASRPGETYLYSTGSDAGWFTLTADGVRRGGPLPDTVFDLAVLDANLLVLADEGILLGPDFVKFPVPLNAPAWVGW